MNRSRTILACLLVAILAGAGLIYSRVGRPATGAATRLPDGSSFWFYEITKGSGEHRLVPVGGWWEPAWASLPGPIRRRIRRPDGPVTNALPARERCVVWTGWRTASTNWWRFSPPPWRLEVLGADGFRSRLVASAEVGHWDEGRIAVRGFEAPVLPRRDAEFQLEVVPDLGGAPLARFTTPNPLPRRFVEWTPEPVPSVRSNGGVAFTFVGWARAPVPAHAIDVEERWDPQVTITREGHETKAWRLEAWELEDATGNRGLRLNPTEPAWRCRARFVPTLDATFESSETWERAGLRIPGPGMFAEVPPRVTAGAVGVDLIALAGPGRYELTGNRLEVVEARADVRRQFGIQLPTPGVREPVKVVASSAVPFLLFRLTSPADAAGVVIRWRGAGGEWRSADTFRVTDTGVRFCAFEGVGSADTMEVRVHGQRRIEWAWTVKPPGR